MQSPKVIKWMKYRFVYFAFSGILLAVGIYSLIVYRFKMGIDFTGGAVVSYQIKDSQKLPDIQQTLQEALIKPNNQRLTNNNILAVSYSELTNEQRTLINQTLKDKVGDVVEEVRFETVGPLLGKELIIKTIIALVISSSLILIWVAIQFKSLKFGASAVLAMLHDTVILLGSASLLGKFAGMEVDYLFVTAVLTILSFSVHDTIVVYDRIREMGSRDDIEQVANTAVSGTMRRSVNNSLTIIIMLVALVWLGGESTKWFALALLIGTISGTYSSPFVAVPILVIWEKFLQKRKDKK